MPECETKDFVEVMLYNKNYRLVTEIMLNSIKDNCDYLSTTNIVKQLPSAIDKETLMKIFLNPFCEIGILEQRRSMNNNGFIYNLTDTGKSYIQKINQINNDSLNVYTNIADLMNMNLYYNRELNNKYYTFMGFDKGIIHDNEKATNVALRDVHICVLSYINDHDVINSTMLREWLNCTDFIIGKLIDFYLCKKWIQLSPIKTNVNDVNTIFDLKLYRKTKDLTDVINKFKLFRIEEDKADSVEPNKPLGITLDDYGDDINNVESPQEKDSVPDVEAASDEQSSRNCKADVPGIKSDIKRVNEFIDRMFNKDARIDTVFNSYVSYVRRTYGVIVSKEEVLRDIKDYLNLDSTKKDMIRFNSYNEFYNEVLDYIKYDYVNVKLLASDYNSGLDCYTYKFKHGICNNNDIDTTVYRYVDIYISFTNISISRCEFDIETMNMIATIVRNIGSATARNKNMSTKIDDSKCNNIDENTFDTYDQYHRVVIIRMFNMRNSEVTKVCNFIRNIKFENIDVAIHISGTIQ